MTHFRSRTTIPNSLVAWLVVDVLGQIAHRCQLQQLPEELVGLRFLGLAPDRNIRPQTKPAATSDGPAVAVCRPSWFGSRTSRSGLEARIGQQRGAEPLRQEARSIQVRA